MLPYYLASVTLNELVQDRGYQPLPYSEHLSSLKHFQSWFDSENEKMEEVEGLSSHEKLKILLNKRVKHCTLKKYLYIQWVPGETLNTNLREIYVDFLHRKIKRVILIYDINVTSKAQNNVTSMIKMGLDITLYHRDELQYNITKHKLQPKFRICSADEKEKLLKQYGVDETSFPIMTYDDPIRKYYGARHGDVFEILKTRPNGDEYLKWRVVE